MEGEWIIAYAEHFVHASVPAVLYVHENSLNFYEYEVYILIQKLQYDFIPKECT